LREIARQMGMTAPALYRYFSSREDLLRGVCGDIFSEIAGDIRAASARAAKESGGDVTAKLIAACREFRHWALTHREEFGLLFGTPLPGLEPIHNDETDKCAMEFAGSFIGLFLELWQRHPFAVPADEQIEPGLAAQLTRYAAALGVDLPTGAVLTFLRCWVRLYGMVSLEVFGHLHFALDDAAPMFEITLAELAELVGLDYSTLRPPGQPATGAAAPEETGPA
jgi:AcrR family transcriptional regulator